MKSLTAESIKKLLQTERLGKLIYSFEEVGSTNEVAFELATNGAPEGAVVVSDSQTRGRGRLERGWISPPGVNLYLSVILRPKIAPADAPLLTLTASIALVEATKGEGMNASIKWPNDLIVNDRKAAGVLTQMQIGKDEVEFAVVGIGVNLNMTGGMMEKEMGEVRRTATSLREAAGREIDRAKFAANLIGELERWYQKLNERKSFIITEWTERWGYKGRRVQIKFSDETSRGIASSIDENGYLLVEKDDGAVERVISGDVILL